MPSKEYRQRLIEELVESEFVSTQSEIAEHLHNRDQGDAGDHFA